MDPALADAYETCRRMHRRHDPTYYWATRRLPPEVRPATHALYGYVRTADQLVDGPRRAPTPQARRAALDAWEGELERGMRDGGSANPVVGALVDAAGRHTLPLDELEIYMRSMRVDCAPVRISSWEELCGYMEGSAGSVGRIMAPLLGVPADHHADYGRLGPGVPARQLRARRPRGLRDGPHLPARGGPRAVRRRRRRLRPPACDARAARADRDEVGRARRLFAAAAPAVAAAPAAVRPGVRLACAVYESVLDRVEAAGYDVLGRRMGVHLRRLPWIVFGALRP